MALTFGEVAQIEQRLAADGRAASAEDVSELLKQIDSWFRQPPGRGNFDSNTLGALTTIVRKNDDDRARALAVGALMFARRENAQPSDRVRFALKFATERIAALAGGSPLWQSVRLSADEEADARALFDLARGDTSYSDAELSAAVERFVSDFARDRSIFGALAADLAYLADCVRDPSFDAKKKEVARAALTYFAVASDAIPDDLGFAGFLDDAFIVAKAMEEIRPERARLNELLEDVYRRWPFVRDVVLEAGGGERPLSEFVLVNAALLLNDVCVRHGSSSAALVVPETGPLPFLIGFVHALHQATQNCSTPETTEFVEGERLVNRETGAEVIFHGYGHCSARGEWSSRSPSEATHFRFIETRSRQGNSFPRIRQLLDIRSFARSTKQGGTLRRGNVTFAGDAVGVGALERLTGSVAPVILPARCGVVIVVAPFGDTRALASELTLYGTPLVDVLPMQQATVDESDIDLRSWSTNGTGGAPMMTIVKSTAAAAAIVERGDQQVVAVVAPVRAQTTDTANLAAVARQGVPVIALVREIDLESQQHLAGESFGFWGWDERWFGALRWPAEDETSRDHPIGRFEATLRWHLNSRACVDVLEAPELVDLHQRLEAFSANVGESAHQSVLEFSKHGWNLITAVCRIVTPLDDDRVAALEQRAAELRAAVKGSETWWDDVTLDAAKHVCAAFSAVIGSLKRENPKWAALLSWSRRHSTGTVITRASMAEELADHAETASLHCVDAADFRGPVDRAVVPAWYGADRMRRVLFAAGVEQLTMILYRPEVQWLEALQRRRSACMQHVRRLVETHGRFATLRMSGDELSEANQRIVALPEEIVHRARHERTLRTLRDDAPDRVDARLVYFSGGLWAAFLPSHPVQTATHLMQRLDDSAAGAELRDVPATDLEIGDYVLLLRGSDRDALRDAVDAEAPVGTRVTASEWKRALRRWVEAGRSVEDMERRLSRQNCRRTTATIRRWLEDEVMIGPRDEETDVPAIAQVTGDRTLLELGADCVAAIQTLRRLHLKVAHRLATKVMWTIRERLRAGVVPDDLVAIDERCVLVVVEGIASELVSVARAKVNRLHGEA